MIQKIEANYKSKYLTIWVTPTYDYDIDFARLRKNEDWWFRHLSEKIWFDDSAKNEWYTIINQLKQNDYGKKTI